MTYSNTARLNPVLSTPKTALTTEAYFAGLAPAFAAAAAPMLLMLAWLTAEFERSLRSGYERDTKTFRAAVTALAVMMTLLRGTQEEKDLFLKKLFERLGERLSRIYARYIIWRQRRCWMWGGGLRSVSFTYIKGRHVLALDIRSYDALIPN